LLLHSRSIIDGSRLLRLGWVACDKMMKRAVKRGLVRRTIVKSKLVGIHEKSFRMGQGYIAVMINL
jgi:hypothetical protein